MAPRSVIDLLAEQPDETLAAMLDSVESELARLTVEKRLIEQARARKARRGSGGERLSRQEVFEAVREAGKPVTAPEVHSLLSVDGHKASLNSVRNHLARLVDENGWLVKLEGGHYAPALISTSEDDDIPF